MKKLVSTLLLGAVAVSLSCVGITDTYAMPPRGPQWQQRDDQWQNNHDRKWQKHEQQWGEYDRQWQAHEGDRDWQREHAHKWKDWYQWHHDNGDDGFSEFLAGAIVGAVLGSMT
ncbi:hypothetical protein AB840_08230 [Megasphaera cerevisiae DSM 20462]|jgi:hypothetical protein|uniref:Lipoprotein n=1 Tax=Megasphaera cerevisiae DSM 20462 TaxID=1122219 RepID=A0A0J6ZNG5_9FIRM|nr:hypothetical protein [Megasphaera cerevisiae]KMO86441.1 hypothetical protein AB840_08230 [Megasphaera cerevisiae DSM 20462]OKY52324.1 hypothetical protein BSR42_13530 [Megasphaera cerevisiae]SJZ73092.1 hypothetical protein SAMN05660900_01301 [Megasphaera cerevisiae DSM 20462]